MSTPDASQQRQIIYETADALARAAAEAFVSAALAARAHGIFRVALSGGSTPRAFHALLAAPPLREQVAWEQVHCYWGDERNVPPDSPESNYRMARETLLDHVPIRSDHVYPVPTTLSDPAATAAAYERLIREHFALANAELPRFDLIFLGMGPDGHTASLFPHTAALRAQERIVVANSVPQLNTVRFTLTAPAINAAAAVVFVVAGADKATALAAVREGPPDPDTYPSQLIAPARGTLTWLVDRAAAARLTRSV